MLSGPAARYRYSTAPPRATSGLARTTSSYMASRCVEGDIENQLFHLGRISESPQLGRGELSYWPQRAYSLRLVTYPTSTGPCGKAYVLPLGMYDIPPIFRLLLHLLLWPTASGPHVTALLPKHTRVLLDHSLRAHPLRCPAPRRSMICQTSGSPRKLVSQGRPMGGRLYLHQLLVWPSYFPPDDAKGSIDIKGGPRFSP